MPKHLLIVDDLSESPFDPNVTQWVAWNGTLMWRRDDETGWEYAGSGPEALNDVGHHTWGDMSTPEVSASLPDGGIPSAIDVLTVTSDTTITLGRFTTRSMSAYTVTYVLVQDEVGGHSMARRGGRLGAAVVPHRREAAVMAKATDIPQSSRRVVHERDQQCCRLCGQWTGSPELHHIVYRSQERNNHAPSNLVTLCYRCHRIAHSHPGTVRDALLAVVDAPAHTGLAWLRWHGHDIRGLARSAGSDCRGRGPRSATR